VIDGRVDPFAPTLSVRKRCAPNISMVTEATAISSAALVRSDLEIGIVEALRECARCLARSLGIRSLAVV
jgi:hypothetical protein